jgi:nucleoside-diphosphate-sugar epimerase
MILVTGGSGFVGNSLINSLKGDKKVKVAIRNSTYVLPKDVEICYASLSTTQDWSEILNGVSTVVHCAARVHVMNEQSVDSLTIYREINVDGTLHLAKAAILAGVKRFIFISTVKVNGEYTVPNFPFTAEDAPSPQDAYAISKMEAEKKLRILSEKSEMEVVIIRPPLVYGPSVRANFATMVQLVKLGIPLPLGAITLNRRSLIFVENLVDFIRICIDHPKAANQTFMVSDDDDVSTSVLLLKIAAALRVKSRSICISPMLIEWGAKIVGKTRMANRLLGSLQVDITKTKQMLGWKPKFSLDEGLLRTAQAMETNRNKRI